ncbi:MAG: nucleotide exchange factor GrpE [Candidatus Nealsonbacteria bacterium]
MSEEKKQNKIKSENSEEKLKECQKQRDEYLSGWQRARADFINYKKQEIERIGEILNYQKEELILRLLPVLDSFDTAEGNITEKEKESLKGFLQIKFQILDFLKQQQVAEIKTEGEKFNPEFHEAVEIIESEESESGTILEEIQKGYTLNDKLIRPAKVKVAK